MSVPTELRDAAYRWIADDVDPTTQAELQQVLARALGGDPAAHEELADRMAGSLKFGTAGLRGPVRAGPNGMNRAVVIRTTAGVATWLNANGHAGELVVVGRDARHGSEAFAADAAGVLAAAGFDVRLLDRPLPTPVLAFAVGHLNAAAGIQITASHNPAPDNGYKLYDSTASQIIPPADSEIEAAIAQAPAARAIPRATTYRTLGDDVVEAYLQQVAQVPRLSARTVRVAVSALHGVGAATAAEAFRRAGFTDVHFTQDTPDPDFGGMAFPNPEEPGACDELLALAKRIDADIAIAFDPDADRCAVGVPDDSVEGGWRMLSGDEVGGLLGEHVLSTEPTTDGVLVATTIVSSSLLKSIAAAHGAKYTETLTGFKWLARAGDNLVFAYEEALGLCVDPASVRDKDGISAALMVAGLAAARKAENSTLLEGLDTLARRHGVHLTQQVSIRLDTPSRASEMMTKLREQPPATLVDAPVDLQDLLPRTDGVRLSADGLRVVVRPSGTEPKLKAYLQVVQPVPADDQLAASRREAEQKMSRLRAEVREFLGA
ncbi:phospho-sugar mutase [Thermocrispum municipale]|jgi:phosphomannomutase|uniref:phospho-sugar mutase n=1 Tax=Thermocrispum municipale TaxID=37926 RepID=UPI00048C0D66|nr:phospho-sugar mutase [Thermocrispum municipale]